jgi:hypothetical protein
MEKIHGLIYTICLLLKYPSNWVGVWVWAFNTTFNNVSVISWRSVLLVEETGKRGPNKEVYHVVMIA